MLTISYSNREEETAATYEAAVSVLKLRFRHATFSKAWELFGVEFERQLVWATPADAACDAVGFRAVAQILRPVPAGKPPKKNGGNGGNGKKLIRSGHPGDQPPGV